jgi:AraC-like DNA-binding protein
MSQVREELIDNLLYASPEEGLNTTSIPGVYCIKISNTDNLTKTTWLRSVVIVVQGQKEVLLEDKIPEFSDAHYIASPIDLPITSRIKVATPQKPFLALLLALNLDEIAEITTQLQFDDAEKVEMRSHAIFVGKVNERILESAVRLTRLFSTPEDIPALAPLMTKEIFYHVLKTPNGKSIYEFAKAGSRFQKVSKCIRTLRSQLNQEVVVDALAKQANMSRASFFKSFKEATALSPIQYQKRLRLIEARRLLIDERETAEGAAFKVGYKSASQFSREYSRMFGKAPLRDAADFKVE